MSTTNKTNTEPFYTPEDNNNYLDVEDLKKLTQLLEKYAPHDDDFPLTKDGLHVVRASKPSEEKTYVLSQPSLCIVPQGAKRVSYGVNGFEYDESKMVVYAAEIPISIKITKASKEKPYFCFIIPLQQRKLNALISKVFPNGLPKKEETKAVYVGDSNPKIIKSALHLMETIVDQEDVELLAPLIVDSILIRLLRSPAGPSIAQIGVTDSHAHKISKAITWLKENYKKPIKIEEMSEVAGMSSSMFHSHFKSLTSLSPLQFQKTLRLEEARNLMLTKMMDVSSASFEVGYASVSQFSREYSRHFGVSPSKDIAR